MTILIAKDEARSAELVQAILLSYLFSCILLNLSAFPISFLPIGSRTQKHNFLFSFLYIILPLGTTKFIPQFLPKPSYNSFLYGFYTGILWGTTTSIIFRYYYIDYFWILPLIQYFASKHIC